jgi:hypothetical protein
MATPRQIKEKRAYIYHTPHPIGIPLVVITAESGPAGPATANADR